MTSRTLHNGWWIWIAGAAAVLWAIAASVAAAGTPVPVKMAVQKVVPAEIGPSDAPVRSAVLTAADRDQIKVQPAHWGGWGWGGWGYGPYYYRRPYVAYYPTPYYYPTPTPYYAYYTPPTYYSAAPNYYYPSPYVYSGPVYSGPAVTYYRYPRRAFYGAYYW